MSAASWLQLVVLIAVLRIIAMPIGRYMARVYGEVERSPGDRFFLAIEGSSTGLPHRPDACPAMDCLRLLVAGFQHPFLPPVYGLQRFQASPPGPRHLRPAACDSEYLQRRESFAAR